MRIAIIGAGMAGLACAEGLTKSGHAVTVFDKGRGPGGRMSTRRMPTHLGDAIFDHGAQYFTARDEAFRQRVQIWMSEGIVAPWPAAGPEAFVGVPGMNAPIRQMASLQSVRWGSRVARVERSANGWQLVLDDDKLVEFDLMVSAMPAEQSAVLLQTIAPDFSVRASNAISEPCWTLMIAFSNAVAVDQDCWRGTSTIGWAARNSSKPGRTGPESWVVQATAAWSRAHLESNPEWVGHALKAALVELLGIALPATVIESVHRWRFAKSGADGSASLFDSNRRLGVCGDWLIGPRVESAWLSGASLAQQIRSTIS
jgi:renalase